MMDDTFIEINKVKPSVLGGLGVSIDKVYSNSCISLPISTYEHDRLDGTRS